MCEYKTDEDYAKIIDMLYSPTKKQSDKQETPEIEPDDACMTDTPHGTDDADANECHGDANECHVDVDVTDSTPDADDAVEKLTFVQRVKRRLLKIATELEMVTDE